MGSHRDYKSHACPLEVERIADVEQLYDLLNCDERLYIKMRVLDIFAERVINARNADVNEDYLSIMYACLEKFDQYIEIQNMCVDLILRVLETPSGIVHVKNCCVGIENCMLKCRRKAALEVKADRILTVVRSDQVAGQLSLMQKARNAKGS